MNENEVILFGKMMVNRTNAASTVINNAFDQQTLWITGGNDDYYPPETNRETFGLGFFIKRK